MKVWQRAVSAIIVWRLVLFGLALSAAQLIPLKPAFTPFGNNFGDGIPYLGWIWANFDGMVFMIIAKSGYRAEQLPFFPLLPMLITLGNRLGLPFVVSGMLVSTIAFFASQFFVYKLLQLDKKSSLYWLFLGVMLAFPTSFFYTAVYADALFLLLASATLYFARKQRWLAASVFGGLAALARLNGLALFFVIGAEYLLSTNTKLQKKWDIGDFLKTLWRAVGSVKFIRSGILWSLLIPTAFLGYLLYIQMQFGDWHLFFSGVEVWHRDKLTFPLQTFWRYVKILVLYPNLTFTYVVAMLEALFTLLYIWAMVWSWGKIRMSYWIMMFLHLLIPTLTGTLQGMPRYGLHLYPLFLVYTMFLKEQPQWAKGLWFLVSLGLLLFYLAYFTRGYFVA